MPELQLLAAVSLNIVCFRFAGGLLEGRLDDLNSGIVCALQETGVAAPSTTRIDGKLAIRICLTNHRTIDADLQILVAEVLRLGRAASR
jgi:glutamate/tyrosine decarboxylase-like PLP-dependent enzyme